MKQVLNALHELVEAGIIDLSTADRIRHYYEEHSSTRPIPLLVIFGVIGALLTGLGIILIVAYNWELLSPGWQTSFALIPILLAQGLVIHGVLRHGVGSTWRESSSAFLVFALGAGLAMISQIFQLPGELPEFLLVWILLGLPLIYLVPSLAVFYLGLLGITWYGILTGYQGPVFSHYWWLLVLWLPAYYWGIRRLQSLAWFQWAHVILPLSVTIMLGNLTYPFTAGTWLIYLFWTGILLHMAAFGSWSTQPWFHKAYQWIGSGALWILLIIFSFKPFWDQWPKWFGQYLPPVSSASFWILVAFGVLYLALFFRRNHSARSVTQVVWKWIPAFVSLLLMFQTPAVWGTVVMNLLILGLGVLGIVQGWLRNNLAGVNQGLFIILLLICCRFFDTNWSFIVRGLLFTIMGILFFVANYWIIKRKKDGV